MKRILSFLIAAAIVCSPLFGQVKEEKLKELEKLEQKTEQADPPDTLVLEDEDTYLSDDLEPVSDTSVFRIGNDMFVIKEAGDETIIKVGKKGLRINDDGDETEIKVENYAENHNNTRGSRNFRGHLGGIEMGYNSYLTGFWSTVLDPEDQYFNLNSAKSSCFNIIFPNVSLGFGRRIGIVTAVGLNYNNYRFDGNNSIATDGEGVVTPVYPPLGVSFEKSKLATVYAVLPVILEAQIPVSGGSSINIGAGVIGAVKLGSHTKVVYYDDGKQKEKNKDDFSLNLLRYGITGRLGYEMVQVYGTCYLSPLFEKGKGPELYPFEIGISLTIND